MNWDHIHCEVETSIECFSFLSFCHSRSLGHGRLEKLWFFTMSSHHWRALSWVCTSGKTPRQNHIWILESALFGSWCL